ncbi:hypothetical protein [Streptomyces sp. NBC_00035]|uniref:hypothetical protein n=1 Tax=Streptomyces sp. NBC_00035 TaxID=2903614 RepID=UPI003254B087
MEDAFIAAARAEQAEHFHAEICGVLNRMPPPLLDGPDAEVIDAVDNLMDDLFRRDILSCPGHRWLSGPLPESIRGSQQAPGRRTHPSRSVQRSVELGPVHVVLPPA